MQELERLLKIRKCHFELTYCKTCDFIIRLWLKDYNNDNSDLIIFEGQDANLDYLVCKCKVAYKDWLLENEGGY